MIDFTSGYAGYAHKVIEAERLDRAAVGKWRHELRLLQRADRKKAARPGRTVIINKPDHLRGLHKVWF